MGCGEQIFDCCKSICVPGFPQGSGDFYFPGDLVLFVFSWLWGHQFPACPELCKGSWQSSWDLLEFCSCPLNLWMFTGHWRTLKCCAHTARAGVWWISGTSKCRGAIQGAFLQCQDTHLPLFSLDLRLFSLPSELPQQGGDDFLEVPQEQIRAGLGRFWYSVDFT